MTNQSSIKYITSLLDNPASISEGDQSSIALFRQTFPYFVPGRYLVALESHKKSPFSTAMLSAMQPYMGDWIMFCDFLQNGASSHVKYMPPVVDVQAVKVVDKKMVELPITQPEVHKVPEKEEIPTAILHKDPVFAPPVATPEPELRTVLNVIEEDKISLSAEVQAAIINASVIEKKKPEKEDISFAAAPPKTPEVADIPEPIAAPPVAEAVVSAPPVTEVVETPVAAVIPVAEAPQLLPVEEPIVVPAEMLVAIVEVPAIEETPIIVEPPVSETAVPAQEEVQPEPVAEATGHAPQGVVFEDQGHIQDQHTHTKPLILEPLPLVPMPMAVIIDEEVPVEPVVIVEATVVEPEVVEEPETIEEPVVIAEVADQIIYTAAPDEEEAVEILNDTVDPEPVAETREQDPLIFPIYTKDYFLQQGEKGSEEIPVEINELKETEEIDEDTSLMVVMSFSEWLLHFKNSAEKQKEETKDQKALKTMWQKEKLAAAMEEENEEIPETVFEMAVNSISKEEGLASETLAEIYMKQGKYDKAIEMYKKLSLRNPQKNVYFARKIEEALKDKQS
jgi:hypothetical protein